MDKVTKVYNFGKPIAVDMADEECKALCGALGKEYLKGYEKRILSYVTTNETPDRYGDIVRALGANLENYRKNPVVMFSHQHAEMPVGCSLKIWIDDKNKNIPAQALFLDDRVDPSGRSDLVYKFAASGFMPACSIGFVPKKYNTPSSKKERESLGLGDNGVEYTAWDYLEFSPCSIPANPEAMQNAFKSIENKNFVDKKDIDVMEKWNLFDANLLDMFVEISTGKEKTISVPKQIDPININVIVDYSKIDHLLKKIDIMDKKLEELSVLKCDLDSSKRLPVRDMYDAYFEKKLNIKSE